MSIHDKIGAELQRFGGLLRCTECGKEQALGSVGDRLRDGWPMCCGYTMTWVTEKELKQAIQRCRV